MQAEGLSGGPSMEPQAALSEQEVCDDKIGGYLLNFVFRAISTYKGFLFFFRPLMFHTKALIREGLKRFWDEEEREIEAMGLDANEYKNHQLPLARIKKVKPTPSQ